MLIEKSLKRDDRVKRHIYIVKSNYSVLSRDDFNKQRDKIITLHPDWTKTALDQVWKFAHIPKGSVIVANRGTTEVFGFGRVTGGYHFVHGERHGHRLPVEWYDTDVRNVNEPGW